MTNPAPAADRPGMTGAGMLLLLLLLASRSPRPAAAVDGACPMNASVPAPAGAQPSDGDGTLWTNGRSYAPSEYRTAADGHGYVLCACEIKPCVRKCCGPGKIYELAKRCTKSTAAGDAPIDFTVGSRGESEVGNRVTGGQKMYPIELQFFRRQNLLPTISVSRLD